MLRVVIADDERPARSFLAALLRSAEDVDLVGEAASGTEAVALIERVRPDLALLDLQMPEVDGLGVVRLLRRDRLPLIAFVTAYDEYAVRAFEINAVDYLLKPIDRSRLREVIGSLVSATKEVAATNQTLDARLKETRGEIESLRETLEAVRIESLTDPLTGVSNRKHFEETLIHAIERAGQDRSALALIVIDIDFFKRFNDTYGHLTGDQVLKLVGMTMRETVKSSRATIARFGGEEFAIILPGAAIEAARGVAESIRQSVMGRELVKRATGESLGKVTISAGVAALKPGDTAVSLLERADQCMYAAKRMGRNRTVTDQEHADPGALPDVA
jgi:diguanylate cyclase (GGDEF)-like protein